jgi:hypothetical protein
MRSFEARWPWLVGLLLLAPPLGLADTWSGFLVDSKCYAAEERNVGPRNSQPHVNKDMAGQIWYCAPRPKTKNFAVVLDDWSSLRFDASGNAMASGLVRKTAKRDFMRVTVDGQRNQRTVTVNSISAAR